MASAGGGQEASEGLWGRERSKVLESKEKEEREKGDPKILRLKGAVNKVGVRRRKRICGRGDDPGSERGSGITRRGKE